MFFKKGCCCFKSVDNTETTSTSNDVPSAGVHNKSFETWEPFEQVIYSDCLIASISLFNVFIFFREKILPVQ